MHPGQLDILGVNCLAQQHHRNKDSLSRALRLVQWLRPVTFWLTITAWIRAFFLGIHLSLVCVCLLSWVSHASPDHQHAHCVPLHCTTVPHQLRRPCLPSCSSLAFLHIVSIFLLSSVRLYKLPLRKHSSCSRTPHFLLCLLICCCCSWLPADFVQILVIGVPF